jgi:Sec-independent protein translocase protein TatA
MESVIINTIPAVASNLGSAASSARQAASDVLDTFNRELSDKSLMLQLQTMSNNLQFGGSSVNNATNNPKVKAMIVEKMIGMC